MEVSSIIVAVRKVISTNEFLCLPASTFNALFEHTVWVSLHQHLKTIADAFRPNYRVRFNCLWDPAYDRSPEKLEELVKRYGPEAVKTARRYCSNGLKVQQRQLAIYNAQVKLAQAQPNDPTSIATPQKPIYAREFPFFLLITYAS